MGTFTTICSIAPSPLLPPIVLSFISLSLFWLFFMFWLLSLPPAAFLSYTVCEHACVFSCPPHPLQRERICDYVQMSVNMFRFLKSYIRNWIYSVLSVTLREMGVVSRRTCAVLVAVV